METALAEMTPGFHRVLLNLLPAGILAIWCLFAVNWRKAWPVLAAGGWAPLVLIGIMGAAVWSVVVPQSLHIPQIGVVPSGIWHFLAAGMLVGLVLFCGWVQSRWGYSPEEFNLDEPAHHHHHDHGHHDAHH